MIKTEQTITDNLFHKNYYNLNTTAFESPGGTTIKYNDFFEAVNVYAKSFLETGINAGDVVTVCSLGTLDTIIIMLALNKIGAIVQLVNAEFFKGNPCRYINNRDCKSMVVLDRFYPALKNSIEKTNLEKLILSSISEYASALFKILAKRIKIREEDKIPNIDYIELRDFIKIGHSSQIALSKLPYIKNRAAIITYTSGTTGNPKAVLHTNDSVNNMLKIYEIYDGFGVYPADRNLVLIPPMYLTSTIHSIFGPISLGTTNILQPIYNPKNLYHDLIKYEPKLCVASKAHYINMQDSKGKRDSLSFVEKPYCGGEAISENVASKINSILRYYGMPPIILGYGQTEYGTMLMFNSDIPDRVNESGVLLPTIKAKIVDTATGNVVEDGQYGELIVHSPATMYGYLDDDIANKKFFFEQDGETWTRTGDIARVKYHFDGKSVYDVAGRKTDSFVDAEGNTVFLFFIEQLIEQIKYVREAEVVSVKIKDKEVPIAHIVIDSKHISESNTILQAIHTRLLDSIKNPSAIPYAYKIRDSFATSALSGKRNYEDLKKESEGFIKIDNNGVLSPISIEVCG